MSYHQANQAASRCPAARNPKPAKIILFDLLSALIDSWQVWNDTAGSADRGKKWRMTYLKLTYGCGAYRPYETLVEEAAIEAGFDAGLARKLDENWKNLRPWPEALSVLSALRQEYRLGVVTNCSNRLGHVAAGLVGVPFDVVVTSEQAGFYKPDARPYRLALELAGSSAREAIFIAGSAYDLIGTGQVGIPTFWHNRAGLCIPEGAPLPVAEIRTLTELPEAMAMWKSSRS
jgi:2-haloalkanoic acid dehalogenase type II